MKKKLSYIVSTKIHHVIIINRQRVNVLTNMCTRPAGTDYRAKASESEPLSKIQANVCCLNWSTCLSAVSKANIREAGDYIRHTSTGLSEARRENLTPAFKTCFDILEGYSGGVCRVRVEAGNFCAICASTIMQRKVSLPLLTSLVSLFCYTCQMLSNKRPLLFCN